MVTTAGPSSPTVRIGSMSLTLANSYYFITIRKQSLYLSETAIVDFGATSGVDERWVCRAAP